MSNTLTREKRLLDELGRDMGTSAQLADRTGIKVSTVRYYMSKFHKEERLLSITSMKLAIPVMCGG